MGIYLDKIGPFVTMGDNFSVNTIDVNKAGTCYICVHHQSECIDKQNHHSIIIDVAGETQLDDKGEVVQLIGLMLHTTADTKTGRTQYCHGRAVIIPNQDLIFTIGQLYNNFNLTPCQWASRLRDAVSISFVVYHYYFSLTAIFIGRNCLP